MLIRSPTPAMPQGTDKKRERLDAQKVLRLLAKALAPLGFERTKPSFFTRTVGPLVEFVHVHKYTFGPAFRLHFGLRVLNDPLPHVALNGPCVEGVPAPDAAGCATGFHYGAEPASQAACADRMAGIIRLDAEAWFTAHRSVERLLQTADSPLNDPARRALRAALAGDVDPAALESTRGALGVALPS